MDFYLKFTSEEEMVATFAAQHITSDNTSIDVIGTINTIASYDVNGDPVIQAVPGWHVNLRAEGMPPETVSALSKFNLTPPNTPYRVWA